MSPKKNFLSKLCILIIVAISIPKCATHDVYCLESIKQSLQDPYGMLSSWEFTNKTHAGFICSFNGVTCWTSDQNRVMHLKLRDMGLIGNFPQGLQHCTNLIRLDLSGNQLYGTIPSDVGLKVRYLTLLDLSYNFFTGEIPQSIGDCVYLNELALNSNYLSGRIPVEAIGRLTRLSYFNVSDNELEGPVPRGLAVRAENYGNNKGLCGGPLEPCKQEENNDGPSMFIIGFGFGWLISAIIFTFGYVFSHHPQMLVTHVASYIYIYYKKL